MYSLEHTAPEYSSRDLNYYILRLYMKLNLLTNK